MVYIILGFALLGALEQDYNVNIYIEVMYDIKLFIIYISYFYIHLMFIIYCLYLEMDKSWIKLPHNTPQYLVGLNNFLDFAFQYGANAITIICPCSKCGFRKWRTREEVYDHLLCKPFP